jgi:hypothetical protein
MDEHQVTYREKLAQHLIKNLTRRRMEASYAPTAAQARDDLLAMIPAAADLNLDCLPLREPVRKNLRARFAGVFTTMSGQPCGLLTVNSSGHGPTLSLKLLIVNLNLFMLL